MLSSRVVRATKSGFPEATSGRPHNQNMFKIFRLTTVIVGALVLGGCGSCGQDPQDGNSNLENADVLVPKRDDNGNPFNTNGNANMVPYNGLANSNFNGNPTLDNSNITVIDTSKVKNTMKGKKLPENSELETKMNSKGHVIETRTFLDNEFISKVEKVTVTPKDVTLKVYLKKGGVKEVSLDKISDFRIATVASLLEAAGVKTEPKNDPNEKTKEQILKERMQKGQ